MKRNAIWLLVAALGLSSLGLASLATSAGSADNSPASDDAKRKVDATATENEAMIRLSRFDNASLDPIELRFSTTNGTLRLGYTPDAMEQADVHKELSAQLEQLIEYRDQNADGRYNPGEPVASSWLLSAESAAADQAPANGTVVWGPLSVSDVQAPDGTAGKRVTGEAFFATSAPPAPPVPLPGLPGNVAPQKSEVLVSFTAFGQDTTWENHSLSPTDIKIDVQVLGYPYQKEESTDLTLVLAATARDELDDHHRELRGDEDGFGSSARVGSNRSASLVYAWDERAMVDGVSKLVHTGLLSSSTETQAGSKQTNRTYHATYALGYDHGTNITHDPMTRVSYEEVSKAKARGEGFPVPGLEAVAVVAAALVAAWVLGVARRR